MPITWNSTVIHIFTFHTVEILMSAGPYHVANILDIERFHTLFKSFARGKKHIMTSIHNHFALHEATQSARLDQDRVWTTDAAGSTFAGHAARLASADKTDHVCAPKDKGVGGVLTLEELQQVQTQWADMFPVYHGLHRKYNRYCNRRAIANRPSTIAEWIHPSISSEEKKWQAMTPEIKVVSFSLSLSLALSRSLSLSLALSRSLLLSFW